ncbi:hypothetical protein AAG906_026867 [Vitis piasezkii]|uniref:Uncharacterized protein n=1 Tax=Vitis vinifera TaxID=29760 RepID=A0A438J4J8_VITVI|nr:hypothetical protein CK203_021774 [Vitis vinifera]
MHEFSFSFQGVAICFSVLYAIPIAFMNYNPVFMQTEITQIQMDENLVVDPLQPNAQNIFQLKSLDLNDVLPLKLEIFLICMLILEANQLGEHLPPSLENSTPLRRL